MAGQKDKGRDEWAEHIARTCEIGRAICDQCEAIDAECRHRLPLRAAGDRGRLLRTLLLGNIAADGRDSGKDR